MSVHTREPSGHQIRCRAAAFIAAGSLLVLGAIATPGSASPARTPNLSARSVAVVVVTDAGTSPRGAVHAVGGRVTRELALVHGVAARVPRAALARLQRAHGVRSAVADRGFEPRSDTAVDPDAGLTLRQVRTVIGADRLATPAPAGPIVDVALVDTGVAPVRGLTGGNVVEGPDFSADGAVAGQEHLDSFGHGTHIAGIIAAADDSAGFAGVAPGARVVNIRVGDHEGATSLSRLLAGIDWAVRNRNRDGLNIRVLNLAFGAEVDGSYLNDPLAFAVEQAWRRGIVVVTAAGNGGTAVAGLDSPAYDPYVVAVGAGDTVGTDTPDDDVIAEFSSFGTAARTPDVLAPGVGIVSLRVPGGFLDESFPGARIGDRWFRGSGTSQAAAVVSGAAALLLERRPDLDPDAVKALLRATARPLPGVNVLGQGAGVIDVAAAASAPRTYTTQHWPTAHGGGPWRARGLGLELAVERGHGEDWSSRRWSSRRWSSRRWSTDEWMSRRWSGDEWNSRRWSGDEWSSRRWSGDEWSSRRWSGDGWTSRRWSGFGWETPVS